LEDGTVRSTIKELIIERYRLDREARKLKATGKGMLKARIRYLEEVRFMCF